MAKKGGKPLGTRPPPKSKALLLCDQVILDSLTEKVSLIGIFDEIEIQDFPSTTPSFRAFLQLTDAIGAYDVVVEVHDLREDAVIARSTALGIVFPDKLSRSNLYLSVSELPITHLGAYDLVVLANGEEIDRQQFNVRTTEEENGNENVT